MKFIKKFIFENLTSSKFYDIKELEFIKKGLSKKWKKVKLNKESNTDFYKIEAVLNTYKVKESTISFDNPNTDSIEKINTPAGVCERILNLTILNTFSMASIIVSLIVSITDKKNKIHIFETYDFFTLDLDEFYIIPQEIIEIFSDPKYFVHGQRHTSGGLILSGPHKLYLKKGKRDMKQFEDYWNSRIDKDPKLYSILKDKKMTTKNMDKKWSNFNIEFSLFDD